MGKTTWRGTKTEKQNGNECIALKVVEQTINFRGSRKKENIVEEIDVELSKPSFFQNENR